ncbi:MAG: hypothetical protein LC795_14170 [Acidobacteria bacterium]|nr:hypothetical protein [Acidobacteriota bacterium]MCA1620425.1 hypothetical protein [Acidobacteriota bacterium]
MKRFAPAAGLLLLSAAVVCGQTRGGWLRGEWAGTGYQTDTNTTWAMRLTAKGRIYTVDYPSLECGGRWRLLSLSSRRAVFRETITRGTERCAQRGRVVIERLNSRQLGYWFSQAGSNEYTASGILNKNR